MNERERFRRLFSGEPVDRPPLLEEGVRDEVVALWHSQGMPEHMTHVELFGLTPHENVGPDLHMDEHYCGRIMDMDLRHYQRAFHASRSRFPEDWASTAKRLEGRDHIACLWAYRGLFQALGVEDWPTLRPVLRAVIKNPESVRDRMEVYGDFCARMLEMALQDIDPEFIYVSEPISDNHGPLLSPSMYEEFVIPALKKIVAVAWAHHDKQILLSTYGNTSLLAPMLIEAGINILWISEAAEIPDLDYRNLRRKYGSSLGLIGGIPLSLLRSAAPETIEAQLQEIVPPLLKTGRFIPVAGGRIREEVRWQSYRAYRLWLQNHM